jgi:hypothetical protein
MPKPSAAGLQTGMATGQKFVFITLHAITHTQQVAVASNAGAKPMRSPIVGAT